MPAGHPAAPPLLAAADPLALAAADAPAFAAADAPVFDSTDPLVLAATDAPVLASTDVPPHALTTSPLPTADDAPVPAAPVRPGLAPTDPPAPADPPMPTTPDRTGLAATDPPSPAPTDAPGSAAADPAVPAPTGLPGSAAADPAAPVPTDAPGSAAAGPAIPAPTDAPGSAAADPPAPAPTGAPGSAAADPAVPATGLPGSAAADPPLLTPTDPNTARWPTAPAARGEAVAVDLDPRAFPALPSGDWARPPVRALVVPLLRRGGTPYGFLVAGLNRHRPLDAGYRGFLELVAGHVAGGISGARSYQAQQRRAEELAELDRAKTTFFSNISHELRTPLALIMGPVEELRGRLADTDTGAREELEVIRRNGLRLGKLVNTLLDFSRIEAGRVRVRFEPVDLAAATAELAAVFRSAVEKAGLAFRVDCPPLPRPVHVDPGMWEKVVLNLLSNALKFTFDGSIHVAVRADGDDAVVTVTDTGVGVPAAEMPRLFERFHRIENTRARSNEGSGIGLALVKELVGLHGGTITAESDQGTRFTVRVPFGTAHLPADAIAPVTPPTGATAAADPYVQEALRWLPSTPTAQRVTPPAETAESVAAAHVLIADDNADMREYLTRLLRGAGYRVTAVADGRQALAAVRAQPFDLLVSDVMMPHLDGLALLAALRADPRTAAVPVVLLSARAGQEAAIEGLHAGADDYLVKPFAAAELLARVRATTDMARLRNHHARWRTAIVDSLQEAFFVCDADGAVIEINTAFTDILGYGPEGLPYPPDHPWWPDATTDPEAHRQVAEAFTNLMARHQGSYTIPVTRRDGQRLWVTATFNQTRDPDTGRRVVVGTFRDVTAEHHAIQRDNALAALSTCLSEVTGLSEALAAALGQLHRLWRARRVVAAVFGPPDEPAVTTTDAGTDWSDLPEERRRALTGLHRDSARTPVVDHTGAGILLDHPHGPLALWVELGEHRPFTDQDRLLLTLLTGHLAQGLARIHQIDQQRRTAIALQRAILGPSRLPDGFAARYEPATRPLEVGGDWYDVVTLPEGRIGIVVGDCVGHGLQAATVMGQLRSACRALLLQDGSPARALTALDQFAEGVPRAMCTTVFCGVLDPASGRLTYSSAGHPPGILVHPDGSTALLDQGRSLPLAVRTGRPRPEGEHVIPPRATLLLYTDGLVERRRRSLDIGIDQAGRAVQGGRGRAVDDLATELMTILAPDTGFEDDVALLLYRHPAPLELTFPARADQLALVRAELRGWLHRCGLAGEPAQNVLVAAGEACTNAIEHGYHDTPGRNVRLRVEAFVDSLRVTVTDNGRWRPPRPEDRPYRGRGIAIMRALMHQVTITPGPSGTTVDMHTRIA
ncbi:SpoIIE family protein phosphatase [Saccharothrix sp. SC076]|nr:SpoIIE family protein phosphatase [Saccharothrix obliqua]